jgi:hypothetical protein
MLRKTLVLAALATTALLTERESGQELDSFFDVWLRTDGRPTSW